MVLHWRRCGRVCRRQHASDPTALFLYEIARTSIGIVIVLLGLEFLLRAYFSTERGNCGRLRQQTPLGEAAPGILDIMNAALI